LSGNRSRRKGHNFERDTAKLLREIFPGARRGLQYQDGTTCPDVVLPGYSVHVECKRGKKPNPRAALAQAMRDSQPYNLRLVRVRDDGEAAFWVCPDEDMFELLIAAKRGWDL
jgi:hypothetical protein